MNSDLSSLPRRLLPDEPELPEWLALFGWLGVRTAVMGMRCVGVIMGLTSSGTVLFAEADTGVPIWKGARGTGTPSPRAAASRAA